MSVSPNLVSGGRRSGPEKDDSSLDPKSSAGVEGSRSDSTSGLRTVVHLPSVPVDTHDRLFLGRVRGRKGQKRHLEGSLGSEEGGGGREVERLESEKTV